MTRRLSSLLLIAAILVALVASALPVGATGALAPATGGIEVRVPNYAFDPVTQGEPALPADLRAANAGAGLRLVQFFGPTQDAWLDRPRSERPQGPPVLPPLHLPGLGHGRKR